MCSGRREMREMAKEEHINERANEIIEDELDRIVLNHVDEVIKILEEKGFEVKE